MFFPQFWKEGSGFFVCLFVLVSFGKYVEVEEVMAI